MKVFLQISSVALLVAMTGLAGCDNPSRNESKKPTVDKDTILVDNATISVLLPDKADVTLKDGKSKSGRLSAFDNKKIVITPGGGSPVSILIDQVKDKKVTFQGQVQYESNGVIKIRGEDKTKPVLDNWRGIPLSDFKLQDAHTAQVKITSLDKTKQKGIQLVAANSRFRLEEMQLDSAGGKMTLKVTAFHR